MNSVIVRVVPADGVEPVPPNREYFVGTVPASDFVSFDLTARVADDVAAVPIEVRYLASGDERSERISVPVAGLATAGPDQGGRSTDRGLLVAAAIGAVIVAAVGVLMYLGWSNRGGG